MKIESLVNNIIEELHTNNIEKSIDAICEYYNIIVFFNEDTSGYFIRKGFDVISIKKIMLIKCGMISYMNLLM